MTEEEQGGSAPEPEASASGTNQAIEEPVGAVAVADDPAETTAAPEPVETPEASANGADAPVRPRLRGDPLNGVIAVRSLVGVDRLVILTASF